jgi:hypothetical protein
MGGEGRVGRGRGGEGYSESKKHAVRVQRDVAWYAAAIPIRDTLCQYRADVGHHSGRRMRSRCAFYHGVLHGDDLLGRGCSVGNVQRGLKSSHTRATDEVGVGQNGLQSPHRLLPRPRGRIMREIHAVIHDDPSKCQSAATATMQTCVLHQCPEDNNVDVFPYCEEMRKIKHPPDALIVNEQNPAPT